MMRLILTIIIITMTILLTVANTQIVELRLLSNIKISINILILICLFFGVFIGILSSIIFYSKKMRYNKIKLRQSELEKRALQQQITAINIEKKALLQI